LHHGLLEGAGLVTALGQDGQLGVHLAQHFGDCGLLGGGSYFPQVGERICA
jgi:hypothetical protein